MAKSISELSKEEIAQLYPVILSEYDPRWSVLFTEEHRVGYRIAKTDFVVKVTDEVKKYYFKL